MPARALAQDLSVTLLLEHESPSTWNQLLIAGLKRAEKELGIQAHVIIEENPDKQTNAFLQAAKSSNLVLVATDGFHEILRDHAANFREVSFGVIDAGIRAPNLSCISFADEQAAFLAGACAALFVQHDPEACLGWLSGEEIPALRSMFYNFQEGAKLVSPSIRVIHGLAQSFGQPNHAKAETKRLLKNGVRVLVLAAGSGNIDALEEAKAAGIFVIGMDTDQKALYPKHVLTSITKAADTAVFTLIQDKVLGHFKGKEIEIYPLNKGVSLIPPSLSLGQKQPLIDRRLKELTHEIQAGNIQIKSLRQRTLCNCL
ncbi:MAG: BMP family ABC transporter substrate-binding protein [Desulfovibrio sp.]|nr:BMP family ABC transporter substrate-binding protein [Desulfovibrio sp.]